MTSYRREPEQGNTVLVHRYRDFQLLPGKVTQRPGRGERRPTLARRDGDKLVQGRVVREGQIKGES